MYAKIGYYDKVFIAVIIMTSPLLKSFENPILAGDRLNFTRPISGCVKS